MGTDTVSSILSRASIPHRGTYEIDLSKDADLVMIRRAERFSLAQHSAVWPPMPITLRNTVPIIWSNRVFRVMVDFRS